MPCGQETTPDNFSILLLHSRVMPSRIHCKWVRISLGIPSKTAAATQLLAPDKGQADPVHSTATSFKFSSIMCRTLLHMLWHSCTAIQARQNDTDRTRVFQVYQVSARRECGETRVTAMHTWCHFRVHLDPQVPGASLLLHQRTDTKLPGLKFHRCIAHICRGHHACISGPLITWW